MHYRFNHSSFAIAISFLNSSNKDILYEKEKEHVLLHNSSPRYSEHDTYSLPRNLIQKVDFSPASYMQLQEVQDSHSKQE